MSNGSRVPQVQQRSPGPALVRPVTVQAAKPPPAAFAWNGIRQLWLDVDGNPADPQPPAPKPHEGPTRTHVPGTHIAGTFASGEHAIAPKVTL